MMLGLSFSPKLNLGSHIVSIAKTTTKNIGILMHSMKLLCFVFTKLTFNLAWNTAVCLGWWTYRYQNILNINLLKRGCTAVRPALDASLQTVAYC